MRNTKDRIDHKICIYDHLNRILQSKKYKEFQFNTQNILLYMKYIFIKHYHHKSLMDNFLSTYLIPKEKQQLCNYYILYQLIHNMINIKYDMFYILYSWSSTCYLSKNHNYFKKVQNRFYNSCDMYIRNQFYLYVQKQHHLSVFIYTIKEVFLKILKN